MKPVSQLYTFLWFAISSSLSFAFLSCVLSTCGMWYKFNFKRNLTCSNLEFSFSVTDCRIKAKEPSLPNYLPIDGGRIIGLIPFTMVFEQYEMQWTSSRIWTCVAMSIFHGGTLTLRALLEGVSPFKNVIWPILYDWLLRDPTFVLVRCLLSSFPLF